MDLGVMDLLLMYACGISTGLALSLVFDWLNDRR